MRWLSGLSIFLTFIFIVASGHSVRYEYDASIPCHAYIDVVTGQIVWVGDCTTATTATATTATATTATATTATATTATATTSTATTSTATTSTATTSTATTSTATTSTATTSTATTSTAGTDSTTAGTDSTTSGTNGGTDGDPVGSMLVVVHLEPISGTQLPHEEKGVALGYDPASTNPFTGETQNHEVAKAYASVVGTPAEGFSVVSYRWQNVSGIDTTLDSSKFVCSQTRYTEKTNEPVRQYAVSNTPYPCVCKVKVKNDETNEETEVTVTQDPEKPTYLYGGPFTMRAVNAANRDWPNAENHSVRAPARDDDDGGGPIHLQNFNFDPHSSGLNTSADFTKQPMQMARIRFKYQQPDFVQVQIAPLGTGAGLVYRQNAPAPFATYQYTVGQYGAAYSGPQIEDGTTTIAIDDVLLVARQTTAASALSAKVNYTFPDYYESTTNSEVTASKFPSQDPDIPDATYYKCTGHRPEKIVAHGSVDAFIVQIVGPPPSIDVTIKGVTQNYNNFYGAGNRYQYLISDNNDAVMPGVWTQERFVTKDPDFPTMTIPMPPPNFTYNANGQPWILGAGGELQYDYVGGRYVNPYTKAANTNPSLYLVHQYWAGSAAIGSRSMLGNHVWTYRMKFWSDFVIHERTTVK